MQQRGRKVLGCLSSEIVPFVLKTSDLPVFIHIRFSPLRINEEVNQLFVVGVDRCGEIGNERYIGRSMVISPSGDIMYECSTDEEIASVERDFEEIAKERGRESTFSEFEIVVYDQFLERFKEERDYQ